MGSQPRNLGPRQNERSQKLPCNGVPKYKVGKLKGLTYSEAYDAICRLEKCKPNDSGGITFTPHGLRRVIQLNALYATHAFDFLLEKNKEQVNFRQAMQNLQRMAGIARDAYVANEKELAELEARTDDPLTRINEETGQTLGERRLELRSALKDSVWQRNDKGELVHKPKEAAPSEAYKELVELAKEGHTIQLCTIDQNCVPVEWRNVPEINRAFHPNRYRIVKKDGMIYDPGAQLEIGTADDTLTPEKIAEAKEKLEAHGITAEEAAKPSRESIGAPPYN